MQRELARRLPTLTKADVDAAIRKHLSVKDLKIAVVAKDAEGLRKLIADGAPTPIVYDTQGTPAEVLAEDAKIAPYPLDIAWDQIVIRPAAEVFAR